MTMGGVPRREIGFDEDMNPIVLGPIGNNFGFLVDSSDDWSTSKEDSEEVAKGFQAAWKEVWPTFKHLDKGTEGEEANKTAEETKGKRNVPPAGHYLASAS